MNPLEALKTIFIEIHKEVSGWAVYSGTTACVSLIIRNTLYLANVGDSRAILCRNKEAIRVSFDHTLQVPEEVERIRKLGGEITEGNPPRVKGMISITRALGDSMIHPFIIAEPHTVQIDLTPEDEYLIMASDGLWEKVSDERAMEIVSNLKDPLQDKKFAVVQNLCD